MSTRALREGAGLFEMSDRGIVEVSGEDRVRWLNGMVSNDVAVLDEASGQTGCYAALLTPQGRIVSDLHIVLRGDRFWLETAAGHVTRVIERLEKYIIADDVQLRNASVDFARFGIEGARARAKIEAAAGTTLVVKPDGFEEIEIDGAAVAVVAFGFSGEDAYQLLVAKSDAAGVIAALVEAGCVRAERSTLEAMRIEAGEPSLGSELAEDTLPDEARIGRAISESKGCYTGQEVIARLRSRGGVKHLLVGLRSEDNEPLADPGSRIFRPDEKKSGELTSKVTSEAAGGEIALGFVHRDDAEPGTRLVCGDRGIVVCPLPFVQLASSRAPEA
ncbi:MAG: glycine cleavage T C-terminal barrel domain-containing protein [Myxococcota bacterium]|nr:glycine cleavage T C-terminal barrel domain-containing protein [Myxococcota bacterium]